jgi:NAD+ synthase
MTTQRQIIENLEVSPQIDPAVEVQKRVGFLKDYARKTGSKGFILGISGGQDSTLAGTLAQIAVSELRQETGEDYKFIAVRLPYGEQQDEEDAQLALEYIRPDARLVYNIKGATDAAAAAYEEATGHAISDFDKGNIKARQRMIAQYAIGAKDRLLVIGTDHAAEAVTGFFTKFGDGGADITPLTGLSKRQGKQLLVALEAPERLYLKTPTADLLDNNAAQPDEKELGLTYDQIDDFLEGKTVEGGAALINRYDLTEHKRRVPVTPHDTWWK